MTSPIRVGILGTGFMARVHAHAARVHGASLVGFVGSSPASGEAMAARVGGTGFGSLDDLLDAGVDVVHVCTPNASHAGLSAQALRAGVPVICEKPLATSVADATELTVLARDAGLTTGVPFVYRYHPVVRQIRQRIAAEPDNRLWLLHGSYLQDWLADRDQTNWRISPELGGDSRAFGDIGVHWCDLMEFVTGQRITRLSARLGNAMTRTGGRDQNRTEDGGVVSFETDAGALGSVVISQASAGRRNRLWFSFDGPRASYSFDQEHPETAWRGVPGAAEQIYRDPTQLSGEDRLFAVPSGHPHGYLDCFRDFVDDCYSAISGAATDTRPQFADGLRAALLTDAVVRSSRAQAWVDVPAVSDGSAEGHLDRLDQPAVTPTITHAAS